MGRADHDAVRIELSSRPLQVLRPQVGAIVADGNHPPVALGEHLPQGMHEACAKMCPLLLGIIHPNERQPTLARDVLRMLDQSGAQSLCTSLGQGLVPCFRCRPARKQQDGGM